MRIDRRSFLVLLAASGVSAAVARVPEKTPRAASLEVTYYYLPG